MSDDFSEKRDFHRMSLDSALDYQLEGSAEQRQGRVRNLSARGMLFVAGESLSPGQKLKVVLTPPNPITPPMSANARVLRCDEVEAENGEQRSWLVACEIEQID